jgi:pyruvate dehydrogenase kinase 2/3/4
MGSAQKVLKATWEAASKQAPRLQDGYDAGLVREIFKHAMRKQTGVSMKYMLDFGQTPINRQMVLSAQFLRAELPIRLAHRVAELENLPFGLSSMKPILKVRCLRTYCRIPRLKSHERTLSLCRHLHNSQK